VSDNSAYNNTSIGIEVTNADATRNLAFGNRVGIQGNSCSPGDVLSHNRAWNNTDFGIALTTAGSANGNQVYDNSTGIAVMPCILSFPIAGTIASNLIYDNSNFGVTISQATHGFNIVNNTIYQSVGDALRIKDNSADVSVRNNILLIDAGHDIFVANNSQAGFVSDYNLLHQSADANAHVGFFDSASHNSLADWQTATSQEVRGIATDPQFVDMDGADNVLGYTPTGLGYDGGLDDNFHLRGGSAAIDSAHAWYAPAVDREFFERANDPGSMNSGSPDYAELSIGTNLFSEGGVPQSMHGDETHFPLDLPFAFPFYESNYTRVYVSTEGFILLENPVISGSPLGNNSESGLRGYKMIAPLWDDLDTLH
jgi:hypothetical protein